MTQTGRKVRRWLFRTYFLLRRPMTLGVRAAVLDEAAGTVFLVRHTYLPGWHLPGGGVETGETFAEALAKELREEGNIELTGPAELFALYMNAHASRRDHAALYVCRHFRQRGPRLANWEIAEVGFFPLDALPEGTTASTRRRLKEILEGETPTELW
ncbi:NUDIX domain-containing protein [Phyllobacterium leguminum]|uniref:ADP-ribose pyrophosphatase YjhB (NUDIX family) n=1 Tax=Phyllobacterium leguminum TaxID=314237 RepID=A0A318T0D4_9HYPH|nr:NUDIX domain-containing protein [Phyllobacterium leguminum]PYE87101.1 ADP-ribose pyrophosphatase YjhB (NUDIX family) [Phyllobacterium leguminum]